MTRPGPAAPETKNRPERKNHDHGRMYRCKIVPFNGTPQYGEWLDSEREVQTEVRHLVRAIGTRYYCEMKSITCPECDVEDTPRVISAL